MKRKEKILVFLILAVGCTFFAVWLNHKKSANPAWEWDISNLEIQTDSGSLTAISFEEAVRLEAKLTNSISRFAEETLRDLENEILESTGDPFTYYQFVGAFTFPQNEALNGELTTLLIVVRSETPYIYFVEEPMTEAALTQEDVLWEERNSLATIGMDQTSARVAAIGYFTVYDKNPPTANKGSNTVRPTYTIKLSGHEDSSFGT